MTVAHRQLAPTPQEAALARMSGQRLSRFRGRTLPLQIRVIDAEKEQPLELPAGAVALLMDILEANGVDVPQNVRDADILTHYAVQSRYPSFMEDVTRNEYRDALKLAANVIVWAEIMIK